METIRKSSRRKNNEVHIKSNNQSVYEGVINSITPISGLVFEGGQHYIIFKDSFLLESYLLKKIESAKQIIPNESKETRESLNLFILDIQDMINRKEDALNKYLVSDFIIKFGEVARAIGLKN